MSRRPPPEDQNTKEICRPQSWIRRHTLQMDIDVDALLIRGHGNLVEENKGLNILTCECSNFQVEYC
ncbi:hypothetical protein MY8738_010004 [Beauveria namnaoensis]